MSVLVGVLSGCNPGGGGGTGGGAATTGGGVGSTGGGSSVAGGGAAVTGGGDGATGGGSAATGGGAGAAGGGMAGVCEGQPDGTPCGDMNAHACDAADSCLNGQCVVNQAAEGSACAPAVDDACNTYACSAEGQCVVAASVADGTACGDSSSSECDLPDQCFSGVCQPRYELVGAACGDASVTACSDADTCDGFGRCQANLAPAETPCGDQNATDCTGADTCNGAGICVPRNFPDGTACGDPADSQCNGADTCVDGLCLAHIADAGAPCGDLADTECTVADTCDGLGACLTNDAPDGTPCGSANATECDFADTCLTGQCNPNYAMPGYACGDATDVECNPADRCDGTGSCTLLSVADGVACSDCDGGVGQCDLCNAGACGESTCVLDTPTSLVNSYNAGNNHRGNMFDVHALNALVITEITASPMGNTTIEVYVTQGSYQGKGMDPAQWTLLASVPVTATGGGVLLPYTFNIPIEAGGLRGLYVTSNTSAVSLNYSNGTQEGALNASDANLEIFEGVGLEYPFTQGTGAFYTPRVWNGALGYVTPAQLAVPSTGSDVVDGLTFDVHALTATRLSGLSVRTATGPYDYSVYFRTESAAGVEADMNAWRLLGTYANRTGPTVALPFPQGISIPAGKTFGFYVTSPDAGALLASPATDAGVVGGADATIEVLSGTEVIGTFGGAGAPKMFDGELLKLQCQ